MPIRCSITCAGIVAMLLSPLAAAVKMPALFSDHMVLQRQMAIPVWGWADEGEAVTVEIAGQTKKAIGTKDGKWQIKLDHIAAEGPHTMTVKGANTITIKDVLVGEVWLASGQSNMAMTVGASNNAKKEIASAQFPQIRTSPKSAPS